ncbi:peptide chain release factor N(5)-glutamine methyltransferase [soil metagenome]
MAALLRSAGRHLGEAGSESGRLDAELILGHILGVSRVTLLGAPEASLSAGQQAAFETLVERRVQGEPVAYIRGIKEFYGLALAVDPRALIPRPETELLVDLGLARIGQLLTSVPRAEDAKPLVVWDVGTGSGAIAVALAVECRRRRYTDEVRLRATDASAEALGLATENAVAHGVADMIDFARADLTALPNAGAADLIVANLPYIPSAAMLSLPAAAHFEPPSALEGGPDGLALVRRLLAELPAALGSHGTALLEIGHDQADAVGEAAAVALPGWPIEVHVDLGGHPRVVQIERAGTP